jgi:hypothetical protein
VVAPARSTVPGHHVTLVATATVQTALLYRCCPKSSCLLLAPPSAWNRTRWTAHCLDAANFHCLLRMTVACCEMPAANRVAYCLLRAAAYFPCHAACCLLRTSHRTAHCLLPAAHCLTACYSTRTTCCHINHTPVTRHLIRPAAASPATHVPPGMGRRCFAHAVYRDSLDSLQPHCPSASTRGLRITRFRCRATPRESLPGRLSFSDREISKNFRRLTKLEHGACQRRLPAWRAFVSNC